MTRAAGKIREHRFPSREALTEALADTLVEDLRQAVRERGRATIAVSGGSTPLPLFRRLSSMDLPWDRVTVTLADERWVDRDHEDSNAGFLHRELLVDRAAEAQFVDLWNGAATPEAGEAECEEILSDLHWPLDAVILGMGSDGHTASLFPAGNENREALARGLDLDTDCHCVALRPGGDAVPRMSLTLAALLDTRRLILHMTGEEKWRVYEEASAPGPVEELPVRSVLRQGLTPVEVFWAP